MSGKFRSVKSTSRSSQSVFLQEVGQTSVANAMAQLNAVTDTSAEAPSHRQPAQHGMECSRGREFAPNVGVTCVGSDQNATSFCAT
jgi:hypothetical protein